jgi:uncharacterized protein (TIGR02145 family)
MKKLSSISAFILLIALVFNSCKDSLNDQLLQNQVEFSFLTNQLKEGNGQNLLNIVVTVEDMQGNVVINSQMIEIYNMNGRYMSEPISLITGEYKLSRFMVIDASNNVVYASPFEGSVKANQVQKPLSISFTVQKDSVTKLFPEVLSTAQYSPIDFGYPSFDFEITGTFNFILGAFAYDSISHNYELTNADISIFSDTILLFSGALESDVSINLDNFNSKVLPAKITLPEKYLNFTIEISKDGYLIYNKTFSKEDLRLFYRNEDNGPLIITLEKTCNCPPTVSDADGNIYQTIKIGNQCWMKENLKTTKYHDGLNIPIVTDNVWRTLYNPAYCWYNNDITNKSDYGALYNWAVVSTGKLAPKGWHVPTDADWTKLVDYLGGDSIAGSKLKEAGTSHWFSPNSASTNESGFTALPGGIRSCQTVNYEDNTFWSKGYIGYWWSSTEVSGDAWFRAMFYDFVYDAYDNWDIQIGFIDKRTGLSVRCLMDCY